MLTVTGDVTQTGNRKFSATIFHAITAVRFDGILNDHVSAAGGRVVAADDEGELLEDSPVCIKQKL